VKVPIDSVSLLLMTKALCCIPSAEAMLVMRKMMLSPCLICFSFAWLTSSKTNLRASFISASITVDWDRSFEEMFLSLSPTIVTGRVS